MGIPYFFDAEILRIVSINVLVGRPTIRNNFIYVLHMTKASKIKDTHTHTKPEYDNSDEKLLTHA